MEGYYYLGMSIHVLELELAKIQVRMDRQNTYIFTAEDREKGHWPHPEMMKSQRDEFDLAIEVLKAYDREKRKKFVEETIDYMKDMTPEERDAHLKELDKKDLLPPE